MVAGIARLGGRAKINSPPPSRRTGHCRHLLLLGTGSPLRPRAGWPAGADAKAEQMWRHAQGLEIETSCQPPELAPRPGPVRRAQPCKHVGRCRQLRLGVIGPINSWPVRRCLQPAALPRDGEGQPGLIGPLASQAGLGLLPNLPLELSLLIFVVCAGAIWVAGSSCRTTSTS